MTKQDHIASLSEHVRRTAFNDAKGSSKDSALLGPPSVEFAPYGRVPNSRPRKDARQGTIDQDPEFIDFLESLTNPIPKSVTMDHENDTTVKAKEKVTVTPLVQFLKDKKANKGKENAAVSKGGKQSRQDSKDVKASNSSEPKNAASSATISSPRKRSAQAVKVEQAARDAVKVLNKQAATTNKGPTTAPLSNNDSNAKSPVASPSGTANAALADKKRERGNASAAAKILQRDLGLVGNVGGRGGRRGQLGNPNRASVANAGGVGQQDAGLSKVPSPSAAPATPATTTSDVGTTVARPTKTMTSPVAQPPIGPAASRSSAKTSSPTVGSLTKGTPATSTATQAFLKHANPSQGITEPLLEEAFATFGNINKVEIDKKKGFAYVDFAEPESLQKAIKASPIKVAQGQVVVLERKSGPNLQARNTRGGGAMMGNRGGGMPMGGRGGPIRGRGGFGRGAMNLPNVNNTRTAPAAGNANFKQNPATTHPPAVASSSAEGSAVISSATPAASTATAPAD